MRQNKVRAGEGNKRVKEVERVNAHGPPSEMFRAAEVRLTTCTFGEAYSNHTNSSPCLLAPLLPHSLLLHRYPHHPRHTFTMVSINAALPSPTCSPPPSRSSSPRPSPPAQGSRFWRASFGQCKDPEWKHSSPPFPNSQTTPPNTRPSNKTMSDSSTNPSTSSTWF